MLASWMDPLPDLGTDSECVDALWVFNMVFSSTDLLAGLLHGEATFELAEPIMGVRGEIGWG